MGMKPRRVFVTLEIETYIPLSELRKARRWSEGIAPLVVHQAQANVARQHPSFAPAKLTKEGKKWLAEFRKARRKA